VRLKRPHPLRRRLAPLLGAAAAGAAFVAGSAGGASGADAQKLTLYSIAEQEQYVNNADDRTRGEGNNPFGNYKDVTPVANKSSVGPFPGDEALFSFNLYTDPGLKKRAGSAIFTCQYNFDKNAFCDASFQVAAGSKGTLIASGSFNFNATQFTLTVTGGTGPFVGRKGTVSETPSRNHAQKLGFELS